MDGADVTAWFIAVLLASVGVSVILWFWRATVAYLISSQEFRSTIHDSLIYAYLPLRGVVECKSCGAPVQPDECACSYCRSVP